MSEAVAIDLPPEPESASRAREELKPFRSSVDERTFVDLCLLVDELVVEGLHGGGNSADSCDIKLRAEMDDGRIRVVLAQGRDAYRLPSRRPEPGDPGFGLHLAQRLSDRWGIRRDRDGATVWLELLGRSQRATGAPLA
jgi:anti-sigma regulatory factor (Ser/Thr protein kinase)